MFFYIIEFRIIDKPSYRLQLHCYIATTSLTLQIVLIGCYL